VRAELAAAASVRSKLIEAEVLAQERLVKLGLQENEIKEHISRYNVLQMHLTALQKKEAELSEKMEKQTAEHVSQEKVYYRNARPPFSEPRWPLSLRRVCLADVRGRHGDHSEGERTAAPADQVPAGGHSTPR
jgi:hypothetical protein